MRTTMGGDSRSSLLLTREENELVFRIIGARCQSLATAVVQLFTTEGPAHNQWVKRDTGILCLIKDNQRRSYFFRMYCMQRKTMIWEHEVYNQIEYKSPRPFLHTFEAEDYMAAFNFASEEEALTLKNHLIEKIELRKQRREERRQKSLQNARSGDFSKSVGVNQISQKAVTNSVARHHHHHHNKAQTNPVQDFTNGNSQAPVQYNKPVIATGYSSKSNKKSRSRKLTKADIGLPHDFKHVSHVDLDANKVFGILPEKDMQDFFVRAGVSDSQLRDRDTREFIYDFINSHGGVDAVKEALVEEDDHELAGPLKNAISLIKEPNPPPVPARSPAVLPAPVAATPVVREPPRMAPPPPSRAPPPPPPPQRTLSAPIQAPAQGASGPPPPPPPPPPPAVVPSAVPQAPPMPPPSEPPVPDVQSALMESIRKGHTLKHVETEKKQPVVDSARSDLLSEIRQGIELKSVSKNQDKVKTVVKQVGLIGALSRALEERNKALHSDSDESNSDSSAEEWEE